MVYCILFILIYIICALTFYITYITFKAEVNEVCGTATDVNCSIFMILPIPVAFVEGVRDKVMGYRIDYSAGGGLMLVDDS